MFGLALITYGALAMTAADEKEAEDMYARAEAHPAGAGFPFELARIRLAHGVRSGTRGGPRPRGPSWSAPPSPSNGSAPEAGPNAPRPSCAPRVRPPAPRCRT
ncbi:hypothetical protein [Nonomuraea dietziae]|uniref:hypothetical protein n=1 Tax=Nonomuraea dietziae TaxID=65515 RepID=UPI0031DA302B